ncbi:HET-domain-containing protein [Zopfia rhizophila CBS 207.26]|uniref:HET-domain-containing protein n=1 Tax=Zopfia rhizophila CBS 207.26 TaxID=1314779 RepID=A0A6A6EAF4_9PEZI|nr:HET-domain-containing protein [Zopfia rhizophila CBS 207.26]
MSQYHYSSLLPGPDSIRLLRLMPHEDEATPIQCQLFNYSLHESKGSHRYDALSYVWGGSDKPQSISIDNHDLPVTANLHAALSRLRNHSFERIIWVDAVCIDQENLKERGHQVQLMAKIYSKANRVIVWLGDRADDSDRAVEEILVAAGKQSTHSPAYKMPQQAILALLQRPWFRRIWVLQEVAAARCVRIMCGPMEIDGYAFCSGLESLTHSYKACPDLRNLIRSVIYLIREANFRPACKTSSSDRVSLDIRPLGELVDMFHTHEAYDRRDKVYALLGMSSDNPSAAGLSPDYKIPWNQLFQYLVKYLLCQQVSVETCDDRETAVIKSKGCILGQVSSVKQDDSWGDTQTLCITSDVPGYLGHKREWSTRWTLQTSAKSIQHGDLVCLLQGAPKPAIIRICKDYFTVIMIAVTPPEIIRTESGSAQWPELLRGITSFPHDFLLVWDWESPSKKSQDRGHEGPINTNSRVPEHLKMGLKVYWEKATILWNMAMILTDLAEYNGAEERLREVIEVWKSVFGKEHPLTLTCMNKLALVCKKSQQWKEAEDLLIQVILTRNRVQGADHPDTMSDMANLASTYGDQGHVGMEEMLKKMIHLHKRREDNDCIIKEIVVTIAGSFNKEIMMLLLEQFGDGVRITEGVIEAAARNSRSGKEVMKLLLERRRDEVQITEGVIEVAAGNSRSGKEVMMVLLTWRGDNIQITEGGVAQIARSFDKEVVMALLERRGSEVQITEGVIEAAAGSLWRRKEVMMVLLTWRGDNIQITEGVVAQIARSFDKEVVMALLKRRKNEVWIIEGVIEAAAGNSQSGKEVMKLLLKRRGDGFRITEGIISAAVGNSFSGKEVMMVLLTWRGDNIQITEGGVAQIARSFDKEVVMALLERRGSEVQITKGVIETAAGNSQSEKEVMKLLLK